MMTKPTSARAHTEGSLNGTFKSQRERILHLLMREGHDFSRRMIAYSLNMETATVAARVHALMETGEIVRSRDGVDPHTGKIVEFVKIAWPQEPEQLELI